MAILLNVSKATHRAGEHRAPASIYPLRMLIATHEEPLPVFTASAYVGPLTWQTSAGTLSVAPGGGSATLTPPNRTQVVVVTAFDQGAGNQPGQRALTTYSTFPLAAAWEYEVQLLSTTKRSEGEDRSAAFRRREAPYTDGRGGSMYNAWKIDMPGRELIERQLYEAHHQWHDIDLEFYFLDAGSNYLPRLVRYTTGMGARVSNYQRHSISCSLEEIAVGDSFLAA